MLDEKGENRDKIEEEKTPGDEERHAQLKTPLMLYMQEDELTTSVKLQTPHL